MKTLIIIALLIPIIGYCQVSIIPILSVSIKEYDVNNLDTDLVVLGARTEIATSIKKSFTGERLEKILHILIFC